MPSRQLQILTTSGADGARWQELVDNLPAERRDVHYMPGYARIYETTYGQKARLAVFGDDENYIIQPFVVEDVRDLAFMADWPCGQPVFDISSLYGYGGPLARTVDSSAQQVLYADFFHEFGDYCRKSGIVAEYARLHPLLRNDEPIRQGGRVELEAVKPVVCFDLSKAEDALWQGVCRGHRSSINKARKAGVQVVRQHVGGSALDVFISLYAETMERAGAGQSWHFPPAFFANCRACLGDSAISLFEARLEEVVVASYLVIHVCGIAYYHFGGSSAAHFDLRANNLLLYEIALWARRQGMRWFHLGGGYQKDDSVYRFKAGFTSDEMMVYSYRLKHDLARYDDLCRRKERWAAAKGYIVPESGFFPAYRRQEVKS